MPDLSSSSSSSLSGQDKGSSRSTLNNPADISIIDSAPPSSLIEPNCKIATSKGNGKNTEVNTFLNTQNNALIKGYSETNKAQLPSIDLVNAFLNEGGESLEYLPRLDYKPVLISKLPNEIMLSIVSYLALYATWSIPSFAMVCKRFFLYTRDPNVWKHVCISVFKTPWMTLKKSQSTQKSYLSKYNDSWLCMFIARSRIHYDGVYISTCQYLRHGVSDTGWNQPVHLVTYYRYIRFFPNGTVLHHTTTQPPEKVVRDLKYGFHKRQTFHGTFSLVNEDSIQMDVGDPNMPREKFHLALKIKETKGRRIKLGWESYSSIRADGRSYPFDMDMLKPFFFSPVRAYKVDYTDGLLQ